MPTGPEIILTLKVLVAAVTVLFAASIAAIAVGNRRLHGRINTVFFALTILTVLGFEALIRLGTDVTSQFSEEARQALRVHLCFSIPAAVVLPVQYVLGLKGYRKAHVLLGAAFAVLWVGTFVTGVFFLPHE
jgi:uncharacterized membrane protein YozB (DUF420 family)